MANIDTLVSLHIVDALGVKATMPVWIFGADTLTLAQLATAAGSVASATDAIISGKISRVTASVNVPLPGGMKATPTADSRVEETGLFNFSQNGSTYKYGIDVPSISDTVLAGGRINLANAAIIAWRALFEGTIGAFASESTAFRALLLLVDALVTFRKHRKQMDRVSTEAG